MNNSAVLYRPLVEPTANALPRNRIPVNVVRIPVDVTRAPGGPIVPPVGVCLMRRTVDDRGSSRAPEPTAVRVRSSAMGPEHGPHIRWIPVESPNGSGYVRAQYVAEAVDLEFFLADDRPVQLLRRLARDLRGRDVSAMFSPRGLAMAMTNDPRMITREALDESLNDRFATEESRALWTELLDPLGEALQHAEDLNSRSSHSRTALIPVELWNFEYLVVNAKGHPPWMVYFEYVKGKPYIVGIGLDV